MKIIYLIAGTYRPAGMERVLANKANALVREGNELVVVTTDQRGRENAFELDPGIRRIDLDVNYESNNGGSFASKLLCYPFKQLRHFHKLRRVLMAQRADIVVSMFCNDANFLPRIKDGSRKVLEIHFSRFKRLQYGRRGLWALADKLRSRGDAKTVARYDAFVVLTEEDKTYWGQLRNIRVIPNARTFAPLPSAPSAESRPRVVLAVGRYNAQKAFDRLIDAWNRIPKRMLDEGWILRIVGDGELRDALQSQVHSLGLDGSVVLGKPGSGMKEIYGNASIYAMSSLYEGLPMVLLEAQAAALPIVSVLCKCGPRDVVTDGVDGFLVPEGDVEALSQRLSLLMDDAALRSEMGAAALAASERFDEQRIMQMWRELFSELCNR